MSPSRTDIDLWRHHWQEETDAAFLYLVLAREEPDPQRQELYRRLAKVEERHMDIWHKVFTDHDLEQEPPTPSLQARILAWVARRFGPSILVPLLLREEGQEVKSYLALYDQSDSETARDTARTLARESAQHAQSLGALVSSKGEAWHRKGSGDLVRNIVYGFNDGLTANFGLIAGVIGASVDTSIVIITGLAGVLADALSMASSGYLAAKSEQEVYRHEIDLERREIQLMPEVEEEELALIYQAKGMDEERAKQLARQTMQTPQRALEEMVREELKIGEAQTTPLREGWITGSATAVGALIPVSPFFFLEGAMAIWASFVLAMSSHFAVGAARSLFTGLGMLRSGLDMFVVGVGVAVVGYFLGELLAGWL